MNVAALLQDAPSDDHRRRQQLRDQQQRQQQPSPEHDRERGPPPASSAPSNPQSQPPPQANSTRHSQSSQHSPPPSTYFHQQPSRHARPPSPPRSYSQESPGHLQGQRLPPPSAIMADPYDVRPRRVEGESHHEAALRAHHSSSSSGAPSQVYTLEPRVNSSRQAPPPHHGLGGAPSPIYIPPAQQSSSRPLHSLPSKYAGSPVHGSGSVPLYPTTVVPGMGPPPPPPPPSHLSESRAPAGYNEPSIMYSGHSGHPYAPPGASIIGTLPPPSSHHHSNSQSSNSSQGQSRRRTGSGGERYVRENDSPMGSLQQPVSGSLNGPLGDREGGQAGRSPRGQQGIPGGLASSLPLRSGPPPAGIPVISGPGLSGPASAGAYDRERERERERDQRERDLGRAREISRERRDIERDRQRELERHREMDREERMRERDRAAGIDEMEREREWVKRQHAQAQAQGQGRTEGQWTRMNAHNSNPYGKMFEEARDREEEARERRLVSEKFPDVEEIRLREEWELERQAKQMVLQKHAGREMSMKERERELVREADVRRERPKESRRALRDEHGWFPESRSAETWAKNMEREREQERLFQREREREREREKERELAAREDMESSRVSRQVSSSHHHHHLHHQHRHVPSSSHSSQGPSSASKSKSSRAPDVIDLPLGPSGMAVPPGMVPPHGADRPSPHPNTHKPKTSGGQVPPIPGQHSIPPQHLHPSQIIHDHYQVPPSSKAYPHRRSPPPPSNSMPFTVALPSAYMSAPSPRPPLPPTLPPIHLGTFIYPHTPFPFLDFTYPPEAPLTSSPHPPAQMAEKEIREIRATIYIPSGFLPTKKPSHPKIWGGALIPSFTPLFATPHLVNHIQSGMPVSLPYQSQFHGKSHPPHPLEVNGLRRVYTDDSDLFLCVMHAGWVRWSGVREARKEGRDLRVEVRLTREARFVGGFGSCYLGGGRSDREEDRGESQEEDFVGEDDGRTLLSAGWGNSHDGSGVEIMNAQFVKKGTAHAHHSIQNRDQRVLEYSDRHYALTCTRQTRKRRRLLYQATSEDSDEVIETENKDSKAVEDRTIVFGRGVGWSQAGFEYNPENLRVVLFPKTEPSAREGTHDDVEMDVDDGPASTDVQPTSDPKSTPDSNSISNTTLNPNTTSIGASKPPCIYAHTKTETFLIYPQMTLTTDHPPSSNNPAVEPQPSFLRYTIAVVTRTPIATPKLDSKDPAIAADQLVSTSAQSDVSPPPSTIPIPIPEATSSAVDESDNSKKPLAAEPSASKEQSPDGVADMSMSPSEAPKTPVKEQGGDVVKEKENDVVVDDKDGDKVTGNAAAAEATTVMEKVEKKADEGPVAEDALKPAEEVESEKKDEPTGQELPSSTEVKELPAPLPTTPPPKTEYLTKLQVLQRDILQEQFVFDNDGVGVVSDVVENGERKGWKMEVRSWRLAGEEVGSLIENNVNV